jgi:hypothetical protein
VIVPQYEVQGTQYIQPLLQLPRSRNAKPTDSEPEDDRLVLGRVRLLLLPLLRTIASPVVGLTLEGCGIKPPAEIRIDPALLQFDPSAFDGVLVGRGATMPESHILAPLRLPHWSRIQNL